MPRKEYYKNNKEKVLKHAHTYHEKHYEGNEFQLLCANCNWIKRHENKEWTHYARIKEL